MNAKHSPGPWEQSGRSHDRNNPVIEDRGAHCVAEVLRPEDARLIAAAPEMYELLELIGDELARPSDARALLDRIDGKEGAMSTKEDPGQFDCYAKAEPDEPMFVLLGRDLDAPDLVRFWARIREKLEGRTAQVLEARACAEAMERWREKHRP